MSTQPVVSVLIPTYNYARYLPETLDSVLAQDLDALEIIIGDDASGDDTEPVVRAYVERDSRISFTRHERNIGMVENWNWCLAQAKGTYIKYLLADDKLNHPAALRRMAAAMDENPEAALAVSARSIIDESSQPLRVVKPLGRKNRIFNGERMIKRCLDRDAKHINPVGEPSAVMFRRDAGLRGFDTAYRQLVDVEMWFHLLQSGDLAYLAEPLCCFRKHAGQQTEVNKQQFRHQKEEFDLCRKYTHASSLKRVLFHKMYRISKLNEPGLQETLHSIRNEFTPLEYARYLTGYKLNRPFSNAKRSLIKRLSGEDFID